MDGLETISEVTQCKPVVAPAHTCLVALWVEKGRLEEQSRVESFFTPHRRNRKATKAALNPPCLWEQGHRTAKWLEGGRAHSKVSPSATKGMVG